VRQEQGAAECHRLFLLIRPADPKREPGYLQNLGQFVAEQQMRQLV
jgi:hypothetical protein